MKNLEIVFGNSCYHTMKNSNLENNHIKSVSLDYYDKYILETLVPLGKGK